MSDDREKLFAKATEKALSQMNQFKRQSSHVGSTLDFLSLSRIFRRIHGRINRALSVDKSTRGDHSPRAGSSMAKAKKQQRKKQS
jgi:hypothetical protein